MVKKSPPKRVARKAARKAPVKKAAKASTRAKPGKLDMRMDRFVDEYMVDLNGAQAAIRAGYSEKAARQIASELLARVDVADLLARRMKERSDRTAITADNVVKELWDMAQADPRELISLYRTCCRYCWGVGHLYQFTPNELETARALFERKKADAKPEVRDTMGEFDPLGGIGFNPRKDPHPECPECFGDGTERVVAKDTRTLSPQARRLLAGVKVTQHGLQIVMHDQRAAMVDVGRHLGIFKDRVELTGKDGKPIRTHQTIGDVIDEIDGAGTGLPNNEKRRRS